MRAGRATKLKEPILPAAILQQQEQSTRRVISSWHEISHGEPDRSLLSNSACALLPGQRAQRSLHPETELSFSMSRLPRTRNLVAQAGKAHSAMLLTVF